MHENNDLKDALESVPCEVYSVDDLNKLKFDTTDEPVMVFTVDNPFYWARDGNGVIAEAAKRAGVSFSEMQRKVDDAINLFARARENGGPIEITDEMVQAGADELLLYPEMIGPLEAARTVYAAMEAKRREGK